MRPPPLGQLVQSFFTDHLPVQKGLRPGSIRSYRDTLRLFLCFVAKQIRRPITVLNTLDLTFEQVLAFLKHLEQERGNSARTRNQRRAALNTSSPWTNSVALCRRLRCCLRRFAARMRIAPTAMPRSRPSSPSSGPPAAPAASGIAE